MGIFTKCSSVILLLAVVSWMNALFALNSSHRREVSEELLLAKKRVHKDVQYSTGQSQVLDIYVAEHGVIEQPVVLFVHGGGWHTGDKKRVGAKPKFFNDLGYTFVSMNYRLADEAKHPAQVNDVVAAIRWLLSHANDYGLDISQFSLMGHSAGAHLVALASLQFQSELQGSLKNVILIDTASLDLVQRWHSGGFFMRRMIANNFKTDDASLKEASPITYVDRGVKLPRFLLLAAGRESSTAANRDFQSRLEGRGAEVRYIDLPDLNHMKINRELGEGDAQVTKIVRDFLIAK